MSKLLALQKYCFLGLGCWNVSALKALWRQTFWGLGLNCLLTPHRFLTFFSAYFELSTLFCYLILWWPLLPLLDIPKVSNSQKFSCLVPSTLYADWSIVLLLSLSCLYPYYVFFCFFILGTSSALCYWKKSRKKIQKKHFIGPNTVICMFPRLLWRKPGQPMSIT